MAHSELVRRLSTLPTFRAVPEGELEWLAAHGRLERYEPGVFRPPGARMEELFILLSGRVAVFMDRGVGPRRVLEWSDGDVTGLLPFSRASRVSNDVRAEVLTEVLTIDQSDFPEMIASCPEFTALTVHVMVDRARRVNSSDLQDEKTMSLGKLAAALAHELNNPASAAMRGARMLRSGLSDAERASRELCRAGLSENQVAALEELGAEWWKPFSLSLSLDREGEIEDWLVRHGLDAGYAFSLVDTSIRPEDLDRLAELVPPDALDAAIRWVVAGSATRLMAQDVEEAAVRIFELVGAVKRFTQMDKAAGLEAVDVAEGLKDTLEMVAPKIRAKGIHLTFESEGEARLARAIASDLNQVWMNLIDNAVDAVDASGCIEVALGQASDRVTVSVIDDGPGIPPEIASRIFDPFFTTKPPGQGLGLGLETARQLLRRCGGEISMSSEPGRTEFRVSLLGAVPDGSADTGRSPSPSPGH